MGKISDFLKGDASSTHSNSNGATRERTGSLDGDATLAKHRKDIVGNHGSRGHNSVAANGLDEITPDRHSSGADDYSSEATGRRHRSSAGAQGDGVDGVRDGVREGGRHRGGVDADGDGLDDRATGNKERMIGANGDFGHNHSDGHARNADYDLSGAEHTHAHLAPVTHEQIKHHETEEIRREREHHDHIHHVKHAVVPIHDREVRDEVHRNKVHAPTRIDERHVNSAEDKSTFASIGERHHDTTHHHDRTKEVIDLGEETRRTEHHHVHNVIQPVIEKETHDRHRKHTTIPIHHTTHQAPIIHDSVHHSPLSMDEFMKRGGKLDSTTTHSQVGESVLAAQECERKVDGPAEGLMAKLGLNGH